MSIATEIRTLEEWNHQIDNVISQNEVILMNFTSSTSCLPCDMIEPIFEKLVQKEGNVLFFKIYGDVRESKEIVGKWGVQALPTFIFARKENDNLKELDRVIGAAEIDLQAKFSKHII